MNEQGDDWPSEHVPLIHICDENVQFVRDDSRLESQPASGWEYSNLMHAQQGQLQDYSRQRVPRESADYHVGSVQESTVSDPYQKSSPVYLRQQPHAGIGASSHHPNSNGFANVLIPNPYMATNNEPWSSYNILNSRRDPRHANQMQMIAEQHASDATCSMFGRRDGPDSVYPRHNGLESTVSNSSSECFPFPFPPSAPVCQTDIPAFSDLTSFGSPSRAIRAPHPGLDSRYGHRNYGKRALPLKKTGGHRGGYHLLQSHQLAPPRQRRVSSASSQTTEGTSSSAVSDHTSEVLTCHEDSCNSNFSGKYRKGNQTRHMKTCHSNEARLTCEICNRTFARSDALLKHFRKQHSQRAADTQLLPRSKGTSPSWSILLGNSNPESKYWEA